MARPVRPSRRDGQRGGRHECSTFVDKAAQAGMTEVEAGKLALAQGQVVAGAGFVQS